MAATAATRTVAQNRAIHGLVARVAAASGLSRADLDPMVRRLCHEVSGQEHTSLLNQAQAARLIHLLGGELASYRGTPGPEAHAPWGARGPGPRKGQTITPKQQRVIAALFDMLGWDAKARQAYCLRQCKVPWPQTLRHADQLIEPLSEIVLRGKTSSEMLARAQALRDQPGLDDWKRRFVNDLIAQCLSADPDQALTPHKLAKLIECEQAADAA